MERETSFETVALGVAASSSQVSSLSITADEGRFVPGTLLNGRYRIIGLLGRGGMGEVYRATDLTLGQSVALKFLPTEAASNQRLLERFHGEVRVARVVSHPNVCRVYDIGEAEGMPFLSMEYVDGEDLASLLLRIGRLPADKALQTARKICAGLAAAHDRGVIHRDLKPHNIMMNKRGEVVIMDFGLAAIADQLSGAEARNGTPAYMSPEQLKGSEVTARSDIYALGLVLYELFTGKRPYEGRSAAELLAQQESRQLMSMTSVAADIDPAVEDVIRRCLDPEPARRPGSALLVSSALPGGDPLAAALAAGETPSPEIVAAAGKTEGLRRRYAVPCLVLCVAGIIGSTFVRGRTSALVNSPAELSPEVLAQKARDVAKTLGWTQKPADSTYWVRYRHPLFRYLRDLPEQRWDQWLAAEAPLQVTYRESASPLAEWPFGHVTETHPALSEGRVNVEVDGNGRLRSMSGYPYAGTQGFESPVGAEVVFGLAGLDIAKFTESAPSAMPKGPADQVKSWTGPHPVLPSTNLQVDIAWWKGQVTHAVVRFPWQQTAASAREEKTLAGRVRAVVLLGVAAAGILFAFLLARKNWKVGRVDRRGAVRLAAAKVLLAFVYWLGFVHPASVDSLLLGLDDSAARWLFAGAFTWLLYLALEPSVRSKWPQSLVTWNRLLAGHWKDPQVCAHVLIGAGLGAMMWCFFAGVEMLVNPLKGYSGGGNLVQSLGMRQWVAVYAGILGNALNVGMVGFFAIFGLRRLLRRDVLAAVVAAILFVSLEGGVVNSPQWMALAAMYFAIYGVLIFVLLRLGLVTTLTAIFFVNAIGSNILGTEWKTWYAPYGIATICMLVAIASVAFWRALGDRGLLSSEA